MTCDDQCRLYVTGHFMYMYDHVQGCVLSPRLLCSVSEIAMARWRLKAGHAGFDLGDGLRQLLDLRFADDVVFLAESEREAAALLDSLVAEFAKVGLVLNAPKTVALTTQAQPPVCLSTGSVEI